MTEKSGSENVSTKLERIATLAKQMPEATMTSLSHHIDMDWLREAYRRTRKDGAPGVDRQTAREYAENLEGNLRVLLDRAKSGDRYRAPPVRRVHIPKGDGKKTRPIGIPTFEDKVLQRAVAMAVEAVYEQDFLDCSYGFRPGRSQHQALQATWKHAMRMGGGWVLELDIEDFFGSIDRAQLREILRKRVRDGVVLRLIGKWLHAGVFLHEVLDLWFEREVKPRLKGRAHLVRYADDAIVLFEHEGDARRVLSVLPKRFGKYGLRLHPEKTRLVRFGKPKSEPGCDEDDPDPPGSFGFLGFTHYWGRSRKGNWVVKRKTASVRFSRARRAISVWLRRNRHEPIVEQHRMLTLKLRGHDAYYGITGNGQALARLRHWVKRDWLKWLSRRSRAAPKDWKWMNRMLRTFPLPAARVVHSVLSTAAKL